MSSSSNGEARERRVSERRAVSERRLGERRQPERAVAGRRVLYVNDRRTGGDRRVIQSAAVSPA
jgi:hypothetical protein